MELAQYTIQDGTEVGRYERLLDESKVGVFLLNTLTETSIRELFFWHFCH